MNRILAIVALLLALVACSREKVDETVAQVQKLTVQICSFLPSVQTVTDIIAASNPVVTGANAIAKAICQAVSTNPAAVQPAAFVTAQAQSNPGPCPEVNGVCIKGEFVKPTEPCKGDNCAPNIPRETEPPPPGQDVPKDDGTLH